jgi:mannosylglycoprotein endo-beta-mannosidase
MNSPATMASASANLARAALVSSLAAWRAASVTLRRVSSWPFFGSGGDFNLVREAAEKSTGNVNDSLVQLFNHFIDDVNLREMHRQGGSFTWTNKHEIPIMAILDRVFVSNDWESNFPLATIRSLTRIGSDHNPILVETENEMSIRSTIFRVEPAWFSQESFMEWVINKWPVRRKTNILDHWSIVSQPLRRVLRGWSRNWGSDQRKLKQNLLLQIEAWDKLAESRTLSSKEWSDRYGREEETMKIYENEELIWQRRGGEKWLLEGDANTSYFHGIANGRKRKCLIKCLVEGDRNIEDKEELKTYITNFYKVLFDSEPDPRIRLDQNF